MIFQETLFTFFMRITSLILFFYKINKPAYRNQSVVG